MNDSHSWAITTLKGMGYELESPQAMAVQITPWSKVYRFTTNQGSVFLKIVPPAIAIEADIIRILHDQFNANVPDIIAANQDMHCFLMKDSGTSVRGILKKNFDIELVLRTINQFASLQTSVASNIDILIDVGVPDWRIIKLPGLFTELLAHKDLLIEDGLSESEFKTIGTLIPTITELCTKLSTYSIPPTLVQPDCNDNNALIDEASGRITTIDLGEIAISHPFFSLFNFLFQMNKHYGVTNTDNRHIKIKETYLNHYTAYESHDNLLKAFELARPLWFIYGALAGYRLINACGKENTISYQHGKFCRDLKELIIALAS